MAPDSNVSSIIEAFDRAGRRDRSRKTLLHANGGSLSFGKIVERSRQLARFAHEHSWSPGERIVISTRDPIAAVSLHLGLLRNGFTSIVVDPESSSREIAAVTAIAKPRGLFLDTALREEWSIGAEYDVCEIAESGPQRGSLFRKLLGSDSPDPTRFPGLFDALEPADPPATIDPAQDAYVLFTSGSTAAPKGVRISHRALFAHLDTLRRVFGYDERSRLLNLLPLHHTDGMNHGPLTAFVCGGCVHRPLPFRLQDLGIFLDAIYSNRITHWIAVPTLLAMVDHLSDDSESGFGDCFDSDDFRGIICSAAPLPAALWERFQQRFRTPVANVYGLTETVVGGLFNGGLGAEPTPGSVGVPVDCTARIVDEDGLEVAEGILGELELRGDNLFSGYLGDPVASEAAFRNSWFRTGDLASRGTDGAFRIAGRRTNLIIRGGVNVQPEEVSEALTSISDVIEAVTFAEPDEIFGERVVSCVTLPDGSSETEAGLVAACREHLSPAKVPARIHIVPALPKSDSGKIQIDLTRELVAGRGRVRSAHRRVALEEQILELAAECFDRPIASLGLRSTPRDTPGWDSFAHLEFVVALEESFETRLTTRDILRIESLRDAIEIVMEKLR
ncbi:MAG: AMP-binding protein [Deltaproteobacteria bacterium]|nr:AMP-binding protein [Deltaproteobacteria bacterium]MBW2398359.1 AMP-binding protein [Deltaproteobacteria bacterium]MBW2667385.1 AMP-binding protein [Deltaproteobacteria bacterium]